MDGLRAAVETDGSSRGRTKEDGLAEGRSPDVGGVGAVTAGIGGDRFVATAGETRPDVCLSRRTVRVRRQNKHLVFEPGDERSEFATVPPS